MKLLAVETSTLTGAVSLVDGERVMAECRVNVAVTHSERLLAAVEHVLGAAQWRLGDLDGLAVAVGPGSFTGLRIGVSTVKALAFATGLPVAGIPTLDALAWLLPWARVPVCPILDARKGEVYAGLYRTDAGRLERLWEYRTCAPEVLAADLEATGVGPVVFVGDGVGAYGAVLSALLGPGARLAPPALRLPSASTVADLARAAFGRGEVADPLQLVPLYVRRSEAELGRERRGATRPH